MARNKKLTGMMPASPPAMGMGGLPMTGAPVTRPPVTRPPILPPPVRRPPLMKTKGMPLAGFMPGPKKSKKGKKKFAM